MASAEDFFLTPLALRNPEPPTPAMVSMPAGGGSAMTSYSYPVFGSVTDGENELMKAAYAAQASNPPSGFGLSMPEQEEESSGLSPLSSPSVSPSRSSTSSNIGNALYGIGLALASTAGGSRGDFSLPFNHLQMAQQNQQLQQAAEMRKQMFLRQEQQLEESKRQHNMQMLERIIGSNQPSNVKMEQLKQLNFPQAQALAQGLKDADLANIKAYMQYIPQDVQQKFAQGELQPAEISGWVDIAREEHKVNLKESIKGQKLAEAMNTPEGQRTPYQSLLVDQHLAEMENKKADTALKQANAQKALNPPSTDHSEIARLMDAVHGVSWDQATPEQKQQILDMKQQRDLTLAEGRARAQQQAALDIPDKPTAGEREHLAQDLSTIGRLDALGAMFNPEFVGPVRGRVGGLKEFFGQIGVDEASMRAEVATIKNSVIQMITGAAVGVQEAGRIMAQLPDMNQSPEVFASRWKQTRDNAVMLAQKRRDILHQTGIDVSRLAPLPQQSPAVANIDPIGSFQIQPSEMDFARQLMQQGKTKEQVVQALQQRRTQ